LTSVQLEQDFEIASNEYENINAAMKQDLPRFMMLTTRFINPLFHSFFYMQYVRLYLFITTVLDDVFDPRLNIFYMILEKINQFSEGNYIVDVPASQTVAEFEEKRGDSAAVIEALSITQRFISTCERRTFHISRISRSDFPTALLSQTCRSASRNAPGRPLTVDSIHVHHVHPV
jgi:amphiphysin